VPKGVKVDALTLSVDFAPTFAELAGATLPAAPDGRSLAPLLEGQAPASWRQAVLLEQFAVPSAPPKGSDLQEPDDNASHPSHRGLRTAAWKYVQYGTGEKEVYDLRKDPDEQLNLRDRVPKAWLDSVAKLVKALASCRAASCREIEARPMPSLP